MTPEQIEKFAIELALGNNGGQWAVHYTEEHKEYWRNFIKRIEKEIKDLL